MFHRKVTHASGRNRKTGKCERFPAGRPLYGHRTATTVVDMCRCTKARVLFVLGLLECFCFSGLMFGWREISSTMAHDGFFSTLCRGHSTALPESPVHRYVPFQIGNLSATSITAASDVASDMEGA